MAINAGNSSAMYNFGFYYKETEKDYLKMKQYFLMAINSGNSNAMYNFGFYYQEVEIDHAKMKQYFLMAIEKSNLAAMRDLDLYYKDNKIEFYKELIKIENKNNLISNKIKKLEQLEEIQIYKKKMIKIII